MFTLLKHLIFLYCFLSFRTFLEIRHIELLSVFVLIQFKQFNGDFFL